MFDCPGANAALQFQPKSGPAARQPKSAPAALSKFAKAAPPPIQQSKAAPTAQQTINIDVAVEEKSPVPKHADAEVGKAAPRGFKAPPPSIRENPPAGFYQASSVESHAVPATTHQV